ncbi:MAG TPA: hypothetical protein VL463_04875 [Kofleriaceae bacterium]|jgi:hypothetical protein|nr:hypothetical protein [Kofleriaceae bacterium]
MRRRLAYVLVPLALLGVSAGLIAGCKQKEGERCETNDDCDTGLVCNEGNGVCQPANATGPDAQFTPDATGPTIDAQPIDAKVIDAQLFDAN